MDIVFYGNNTTIKSVKYIGDPRGVTVTYDQNLEYLRVTDTLTFTDYEKNEVLSNFDYTQDGDLITVTFKLNPNYSNQVESYQVVSYDLNGTRTSTDHNFILCNILPDARFFNTDGQELDLSTTTTISGAINIQSLPTTSKFWIFPYTWSYKKVTSTGTTRANLDNKFKEWQLSGPGDYTLTVRNSIWAERNWYFTIN